MQVKSINHKLDAIKHDLSTINAYKIELFIEFTNDVMYNYIFKVFNKSKLIKTLKISKMDNIDEVIKQLKQCYKCNISYMLDDLSKEQLEYLANGG